MFFLPMLMNCLGLVSIFQPIHRWIGVRLILMNLTDIPALSNNVKKIIVSLNRNN